MLDVSTIEPTELPSLPLAKRTNLPSCAAIYFALARSGKVLYVGRTVSMYSRWLGHHHLAELRQMGGVSIAWIALDNVNTAEMVKAERSLINHFRPTLNGRGRIPKKPALFLVGGLVPKSTAETLKFIARREGRTVSKVIKRIIEASPQFQEALKQVQAA